MANEKNNFNEFADTGEEKVAAMLGSLKRVDAPADFDFRVRARIAQGRPSEKRVSWFPTFARVAAPAMMLAAVGGYFGYNALYTGNVNVSEVADSAPVAIAPVVVPTSNEVAPAPAATTEVAVKSPGNTDQTVAAAPKKDASTTAVKKPETPEGGSVDMALRETKRPGGVVNTGNSSPVIPTSTLSVREIFSAMGIRASFSGTGWRVSSASGRAAAAGLKTGDIIETVNGKAVGANTIFDEKFSGSTLRVKRDGATIQISL